MIPLSDGIPARRFAIVNVAIIAANFLVWILYEMPHLGPSVYHASFYPCTVSGTCHGPEPWEVSWFTAMFTHRPLTVATSIVGRWTPMRRAGMIRQ